ncbi:large ribosomal subunit protein bL35m [Lepisosteus oculatus]|uniref:large ribosomal subunit protein bL35m n=1 Tax=Lepisosteus oculatus TaxID=7918 RepID=UPI0035F50329
MAATLRRCGLLRPLVPLVAQGCARGAPGLAAQMSSKFSTLHLSRPLPRPTLSSSGWVSGVGQNHILPSDGIIQRITPLLPGLTHQPARSLTYVSLRKGKRKSVKAVVKRFLRLHCGLWLRRKAGYKKKLWKKKPARKRRLRQHVFCNRTQSKLLDKMTTSFWKRRNWYANDPYQKYHDRTNLKV